MTDSIVPLVVLYMLSQQQQPRGNGGGGGGRNLPNPPQWPTTRSPPPPLPAFAPQAPNPPTPDHGTPLPQLHNSSESPPKGKAGPTSALHDAQTAATHAARQATNAADNALRAAKRKLNPFASRSFSINPGVVKLVYDLQGIINTRGGTLKRDGLFGPKTAAAWQALARKQGLPPDIKRNGPKTASVIAHTWEVLSVPPIP